ncbi:MAG: thiamine phosphate synthase [Lachnospira sp.]|nr:thiamine phosphate synthase [Lachnospira sp.]
MINIMCVTNRHLCEAANLDFLYRIEEIAKYAPAGIILREKDMTSDEYKRLAIQVLKICESHSVPCILHNFPDVAIELKATSIHLPLHILRKLDSDTKRHFHTIGASCHSVEDATEAESLGCTYITAGHVFTTDCKKDLAPRGLEFLKCVCDSVNIPVYAIGGITNENLANIEAVGAAGACIMSGLMTGSFSF